MEDGDDRNCARLRQNTLVANVGQIVRRQESSNKKDNRKAHAEGEEIVTATLRLCDCVPSAVLGVTWKNDQLKVRITPNLGSQTGGQTAFV